MATTTFQYHTELIDGIEIEKPLPKILHIRIQLFLVNFLNANMPSFLEALPELNVICGQNRLIPDVSVMERNAHYIDGDLADPPVVAVEIMSPGQQLSSLLEKSERLQHKGTPACWIIWPEKRQAWIYSKNQLLEATETLHALDGRISVPLVEMWKVID